MAQLLGQHLLGDFWNKALQRVEPEGAAAFGRGAPRFSYVFHIGFRQKTEQEVDQIYRAMANDGLQVTPPAKAHGAWAFYYRSPWNVMIEIVA